MKKRIFLMAMAIIGAIMVNAQTIKSITFSPDEKIEYRGYFQWGALKIDGIDIASEVKADTCRGASVYRITAYAETHKTIGTFFQMCDTFMVKVRKTDLLPLHFYEHDQEKKYEGVFNYKFYPDATGMKVDAVQVKNGGTETHNVKYTDSQPVDVLSILYKMRCLDYSNVKEGDVFSFTNYIFGGEPLDMSITYEATEQIKLRKQKEKIEAMRFRFNTADGSLFSKDHPVYIWLETAPSHRLVHAEAKLKIGYAKIDIKLED